MRGDATSTVTDPELVSLVFESGQPPYSHRHLPNPALQIRTDNASTGRAFSTLNEFNQAIKCVQLSEDALNLPKAEHLPKGTYPEAASSRSDESTRKEATVQLLPAAIRAAGNGLGVFKVNAQALVSELWEEHIYITAQIQGWDHVRSCFQMTNQWEQCATMDTVLAESKNRATRLAMLIMLKIWRYRDNPDSEDVKRTMPLWLLNLPCEANVDRGSVFHGVPWPAFRAHMCTHPQDYEQNAVFWEKYMHHWQLAWPHGIEDAIELSPITNMYQLTTAFRSRLYSIDFWTLEGDFFQQFPEFQGGAQKLEPQLAIYRLQDFTEEDDEKMPPAKRAQLLNMRAALQAYQKSIANLETAMRKGRHRKKRKAPSFSLVQAKSARSLEPTRQK